MRIVRLLPDQFLAQRLLAHAGEYGVVDAECGVKFCPTDNAIVGHSHVVLHEVLNQALGMMPLAARGEQHHASYY